MYGMNGMNEPPIDHSPYLRCTCTVLLYMHKSVVGFSWGGRPGRDGEVVEIKAG